MPITVIVEDGTGLETANSYVSNADFVTYHSERDTEVDDYDVEVVDAAVVEASTYADLRWGSRLKSRPLVTIQALEYPRLSLRDRYGNLIEGVPASWKQAVNIYALEYLKGTLYQTQTPGNAAALTATKTVVGPITTEKKYAESYVPETWKSFPYGDRLAKKYTITATGVVR